jgi:hypothetical protein
MKEVLLASMTLALGCAIAGSRHAQTPSGTLPPPMKQCLLQENMNWYRHAVSNTNALDDCYVIGTKESAQAISLLGRLEDNGSDTPAPSPWIKDHCEPRPGGYVCLAHGISVWFPNQGPQRAVP